MVGARAGLLFLCLSSCRKESVEIRPVVWDPPRVEDAARSSPVLVAKGERIADLRFADEGRLVLCSRGAVVEIDLAERRRTVLVADARCTQLVADPHGVAWIVGEPGHPTATNPVWLHERATGKAKVLGRFVGPALESGSLGLDAHDVYVMRGFPEYVLVGARDRQLLAFPRAGGPPRVVVPSPGPNTFTLANGDVFWQQGPDEGLWRRPKGGGGATLLARRFEQGPLFVVASFVYVARPTEAHRIPVAGGAVEVLNVSASTVAAGVGHFCWIDGMSKTVSCRGGDDTEHTVTVPFVPKHLAVSGVSIAVVSADDSDDDAVWLLPRPR